MKLHQVLEFTHWSVIFQNEKLRAFLYYVLRKLLQQVADSPQLHPQEAFKFCLCSCETLWPNGVWATIAQRGVYAFRAIFCSIIQKARGRTNKTLCEEARSHQALPEECHRPNMTARFAIQLGSTMRMAQ